MRRHDLQIFDLLPLDISRHGRAVREDIGREHVETAAAGERRKQHGVPEVGRERRRERVAASLRQLQTCDDPVDVGGQLSVLDRDALGVPVDPDV